MRVLALDTGGHCGWAVGDGVPEKWGTVVFAEADRAARWWAFHSWLADMCDTHRPGIIVYEKPFHRGAGSMTLMGFTVVAELVAYLHELLVVSVHNATLKQHAGVKGGKLIEAALKRGWDIADDHQADAVWLLDYIASAVEKPAA